ncbi:MAG: hypothetical protein ACYDBB_12615 [Armatimonadota bacterium]
MSDWLNPGVYATAIVGVIGTLFTWWWKGRKILSYDYNVNEVAKVREKTHGKLAILYEGKQVDELHLLNVKFVCSGTREIRKEDFEIPISIAVSAPTRILEARVINAYEYNVNALLEYDETMATVKPLLMNQNEYFDIMLLLDNFALNRLKISVRIAGANVKKQKDSFGLLSIIFCGALSAGLFALALVNFSTIPYISIIMDIGAILSLFFLIYNYIEFYKC